MKTKSPFQVGGKCKVDIMPSLAGHTDPDQIFTITKKDIIDSAKTGLGIWVDGIDGWIASCYVHPIE